MSAEQGDMSAEQEMPEPELDGDSAAPAAPPADNAPSGEAPGGDDAAPPADDGSAVAAQGEAAADAGAEEGADQGGAAAEAPAEPPVDTAPEEADAAEGGGAARPYRRRKRKLLRPRSRSPRLRPTPRVQNRRLSLRVAMVLQPPQEVGEVMGTPRAGQLQPKRQPLQSRMLGRWGEGRDCADGRDWIGVVAVVIVS